MARTRVRWTAIAVLCFSGLVAGNQQTSVQQILDSNALRNEYNPVVAGFVIAEGAEILSESQFGSAKGQIVELLKEQANISMMDQIALYQDSFGDMMKEGLKQSLSPRRVIGGMFGGAAASVLEPDPADSDKMAEEFEQKLAAQWIRGLNATVALDAAGYPEDVDVFYRACLESNFALEWVAERCVQGIIAISPERAFELFKGIINHPVPYSMGATEPAPMLRAPAIRGIGQLAGMLPEGHKAKVDIVKQLEELAKDKENAPNQAALVDGLIRAREPKAKDGLNHLRKKAKEDEVKWQARIGMALIQDKGAIKDLTKQLGKKDETRSVEAARALITLDHEDGWEWARKYLENVGELSLQPALVRYLVDAGGPKATEILANTVATNDGNEWLQLWASIALLELGDLSQMERVKTALDGGEMSAGGESIFSRGLKTAARTGAQIGKEKLMRAAMRKFMRTVGTFGNPLMQAGGELMGTGMGEVPAGAIDPTAQGGLWNSPGAGSYYRGNSDRRRVIRTAADFSMSELVRHRRASSQAEGLSTQLRWQLAETLAAVDHPDRIDLLNELLDDKQASVRLRAVQSLVDVEDDAVLSSFGPALKVDYGKDQDRSRNPEIQAQLLSVAILSFFDDARTRALLEQGAVLDDRPVQFVSLCGIKNLE